MEEVEYERVEKMSVTDDDEEGSVYVEGEKEIGGVEAWECKCLQCFSSAQKHLCLSFLTALVPETQGAVNQRSTKEQKATMAVEDDASKPERIEMIGTTETQVTPPYIYWKTVRLRHVDGRNTEGMSSENAEAVMVWRRKCVILLD